MEQLRAPKKQTIGGLQGHYFDIYVNSPQFPEPWPAPQMAGIDPLQLQKAKQAQRRQANQQQAAASAAGMGPQEQNMGLHESQAAESGVQHRTTTAESADAETAHGPNKRVSQFQMHFNAADLDSKQHASSLSAAVQDDAVHCET